MHGVDALSFYFNNKIVHAQNEHLYIANDHPSILE
jgi:hypothetical protein